MSLFDFIINRAALEEFVKSSDAIESLAPAGAEFLAAVKANMPPGADEITASLRYEADADGAWLESTSSFFHLIEFGSVNNPAYAPMRRAADQLGLHPELSDR